MTHAHGAALAVVAAAASWLVAARTARARGIDLQPLPPLAPLTLAAAALLPAPLDAERFIVLGGVGVAALTDLRTGRIFAPVAQAAAVAALAAAACEGHAVPALEGSVALGGALFTLHAATRGRGLGLGDVRLACAVGAGLGTAAGFVAFAWAFVLGAVYGGTLLVLRRAQRGSEVRFGPFIAAGTLVALLSGTTP
jgi:leader peptidase (prepilin peptidase)/N-methyltransferase